MSCNHTLKKSISKHENTCSSECCMFWNALHDEHLLFEGNMPSMMDMLAEGKRMEGNMPSMMDTYTNQSKPGFYV